MHQSMQKISTIILAAIMSGIGIAYMVYGAYSSIRKAYPPNLQIFFPTLDWTRDILPSMVILSTWCMMLPWMHAMGVRTHHRQASWGFLLCRIGGIAATISMVGQLVGSMIPAIHILGDICAWYACNEIMMATWLAYHGSHTSRIRRTLRATVVPTAIYSVGLTIINYIPYLNLLTAATIPIAIYIILEHTPIHDRHAP